MARDRNWQDPVYTNLQNKIKEIGKIYSTLIEQIGFHNDIKHDCVGDDTWGYKQESMYLCFLLLGLNY